MAENSRNVTSAETVCCYFEMHFFFFFNPDKDIRWLMEFVLLLFLKEVLADFVTQTESFERHVPSRPKNPSDSISLLISLKTSFCFPAVTPPCFPRYRLLACYGGVHHDAPRRGCAFLHLVDLKRPMPPHRQDGVGLSYPLWGGGGGGRKNNVTRASNDTGISAERVKYQFWGGRTTPLKPSLLPPRLLLLRWVLHTELLPRPSAAPGDNVIMVRESLLSNLSPPRDERTLREHVKHHTPEHLSVFSFSPPFSNSEPHPPHPPQ